jgi:hypothetical protein
MTNDPNSNPYAPPTADVVAPPAPKRTLIPSEVTQGARIAGGLLIVNGVLAIIDKLATAGTAPSGGLGGGVVPIIIDFLIGFSLVNRNPKYLGWAILRAVLGGVIFSLVHVASGNIMLMVFQLAVSGSFLLLLVGDAGKARIGIACSLFGLYALLEIIGLFSGAS